jgi:hypothetical protein
MLLRRFDEQHFTHDFPSPDFPVQARGPMALGA